MIPTFGRNDTGNTILAQINQPTMTPGAGMTSNGGQPNPFAQFVETPQAAPTAATPVAPAAPERPDSSTPLSAIGQFQSATPEEAAKAEETRQGFERILNSGATMAEIHRYLISRDIDPFKVEGLAASIAYRDKHPGANMPVYLAANHTPPPKPPEVDGGFGAFGSAVRGFADGITMGGVRWLHGAGNALGVGDTATNTVWNSDRGIGNLMREGRENWDAKMNYDWQHHAPAQVVGEVAGALALPVGGEIGLAGRVIPGAVGRVAMGSAQAAAYGFNQGEHSIGERFQNAGTNALIAGAIGGALAGTGATARFATQGGRETRQAAQETYAAADRLNNGIPLADAITPMPAHVGGPVVRGATSALQHTLVGGSITEGGLRNFISRTGAARSRIADDLAPGASATSPETLAARLNDPSNPGSLAHFEDRWLAANDRNYSRALWLAGGEQLQAPRTVAAIDARIAGLSGAPGSPHSAAIATLTSLRDDLASGRYTVDKLRLTRTDWGKSVDAGDGVLRGMAKTIYSTLTQDIDQGLRAAGRVGAAQHFARADATYRDGVDFIRNALPRVLGDGEADADKILQNINGLVSTHRSSTLMRVLNTAPPEVSAQIRGSIIARLGRTPVDPATGQHGFSAPIFIRQWDQLSQTARTALFDGPTIAALNDVRTLAAAAMRSGMSDNTSRTAATAANRGLIDGMGQLLLQGATGMGSMGTTLVAHLGAEATVGFLLSRPGVARAIAGVARGGNPATLQRRIGAAITKAVRQFPTLPYNITGISGVGAQEPVPQAIIGEAPVERQQEWTADQPNPFADF